MLLRRRVGLPPLLAAVLAITAAGVRRDGVEYGGQYARFSYSPVLHCAACAAELASCLEHMFWARH